MKYNQHSPRRHHRTGVSHGLSQRSLDLSLLKTCKQIYQETLPLFYGTLVFDFDGFWGMEDFAMSVPHERLGHITSVQLDFNSRSNMLEGKTFDKWKRGWEFLIENFTSLQDLRVRGEFLFISGDHGLWMTPLMKLRGLKKVNIDMWVYYQRDLDNHAPMRLWKERIEAAAKLPRASDKGDKKALEEPEAKKSRGRVIITRVSDGELVKLVCVDCKREDFHTARGFMNHCLIAHSRYLASREAAAEAFGVEVERDDVAPSSRVLPSDNLDQAPA